VVDRDTVMERRGGNIADYGFGTGLGLIESGGERSSMWGISYRKKSD